MSGWKLRAAVLVCMGVGMLGWCLPALAKDAGWLPITPEELAMKDNPLSPGSSAMILYREMTTNDPESFETHYYRIKGKVLRYQRELRVKEVLVPTERLPELKKFYRQVAADENRSAVLKRAAH